MLAVVPVAALLLLTACDPGAGSNPTSTPPPTATATPTPEPTVEWTTYTTEAGGTFELPATWTVTTDEFGHLTISDDAGATRLRYREGEEGLGSTCEGGVAVEDIDEVAVDIPSGNSGMYATPTRFVFRAMQLEGSVSATMGLTDSVSTIDGVACELFNFVGSTTALGLFSFGTAPTVRLEEADLAFSTMADAEAYTSTDDYATLKRIVTSLTP